MSAKQDNKYSGNKKQTNLAESTLRIDKWLWAIRMFKTRSLATTACGSGRVKINGESVKPSKKIKLDEEVTISFGPDKKIVVAKKLIEKRVSYKLAVDCYEDKSPPPTPRDPNKLLDSAFFNFPVAQRERGAGRPTKKERRDIERLKEDFDDNLWDDDDFA